PRPGPAARLSCSARWPRAAPEAAAVLRPVRAATASPAGAAVAARPVVLVRLPAVPADAGVDGGALRRWGSGHRLAPRVGRSFGRGGGALRGQTGEDGRARRALVGPPMLPRAVVVSGRRPAHESPIPRIAPVARESRGRTVCDGSDAAAGPLRAREQRGRRSRSATRRGEVNRQPPLAQPAAAGGHALALAPRRPEVPHEDAVAGRQRAQPLPVAVADHAAVDRPGRRAPDQPRQPEPAGVVQGRTSSTLAGVTARHPPWALSRIRSSPAPIARSGAAGSAATSG